MTWPAHAQGRAGRGTADRGLCAPSAVRACVRRPAEASEVGYVTGDTPAGAWDAHAPLATRAGYRLTAEPEQDGARGHTRFTGRVVNVDPRYELAERVHILVHELGNIRCDHEDRQVSRAQRETEAESLAVIVCTVFGLHVGDVATTYVGGRTDGRSRHDHRRAGRDPQSPPAT